METMIEAGEGNLRPRNATNNVILNEVRDLKEKIQQSGHMSFLQEPEKKFWEELVDSNIRAGSLACLWCLKAHLNKRLSAAFNKWKLNAALIAFQEKQRKDQEEKKHKPIQDAVNILSKYKDNEISFLSRLAEAENDVQQTQKNSNMSAAKQIPQEHIHAAPNLPKNPNNTSFDLIDDETEDFAKLSLTLIDKDIDAETKRRLLLTMSRNILNKTQTLHQQQELSAHKPLTQQSQLQHPQNNNSNSSFFLSPIHDQHASSSIGIHHGHNNSERESWNGYLSRASALDLLNNSNHANNNIVSQPRPHKAPSAFTFDLPLTHSSGNNSVHSHGQGSHSSGTGTKSLLSPSRMLQSHEELAQFLNFRRDAQGQFVKELLSPTSQQRQQQFPSSTQTNTRDTEDNDRYAQLLAQAAKHLQKKLAVNAHSHNTRGRTRQKPVSNQHFLSGDDGYHSDHHSQYSSYSDPRSDFSGSHGSRSRSRSRSASPSAIPGYLQVTRSYLKKTRAGSPPANVAAVHTSIYNNNNNSSNNHTHNNSFLPQQSRPSSSINSDHYHSSSRPSRGAPLTAPLSSASSIGSHSHSHSHSQSRLYRHATETHRSEDEYRVPPNNGSNNNTIYNDIKTNLVSIVDDDTTINSKKSILTNRSLSSTSQSSNVRKPIHIDTGDHLPTKIAPNDLHNNTNSQISPVMTSASALPTPHLYDINHYPHLDNSPSIKAYLEASLRDFELNKYPHSKDNSSNMTKELSTVAEVRDSYYHENGSTNEAYYGKDLLELSALDDDTFHCEEEPTSMSYDTVINHHRDNNDDITYHQSSKNNNAYNNVNKRVQQHSSRSRLSSSESSVSQSHHRTSQHSRQHNTHHNQHHYNTQQHHYDEEHDSRSVHSHHTQNTQRSLRSAQTFQTQRSGHSRNSGRSQNTIQSKASSSSAMEKAQWKLLYGDLQDVGKKDWERTLRR